MAAYDDLSTSSADLIFFTLDYAVKNAGFSEDGFTPFALTDGSRGRQLRRFVSGDGSNLAESLDAGRDLLKTVESDVTCVALAWDGYFTYNGLRTEAVYVEGYEIGQPTGVLFAQRYERDNGNVVPKGNPMIVDEPEPLVQLRRTA